MKIVSYASDRGPRAGIVDDGTVRDAGPSILDAEPGDVVGALDDVQLLAPVVDRPKIVCVGLNYRKHAEEGGQPIPPNPILFAKFPNAIVGPGEPILVPPITRQVDYEAELGVVIGRRTAAVEQRDALDHVLGYTCINDVSARDLQFGDRQWVRGKALDTFCPIGPWIVTTDEIADPQTLGIRCIVNGDKLQDSTTADMIFGVAEIVSFVSQAITLDPGDVIATGTPEGVGFARTPPVYLHPGDVVSVDIDEIGTLTNPVASR